MSRRGRPPYPDILTPREWEVLGLLREGLTNDQIAERLGISRDGAKYHVSQILSKLGLESRQQAAQWQPRSRLRWLALPVSLVYRGQRAAKAAALVAAVAAVLAALAGIALLAALLLRDGASDEAPAVLRPLPAPVEVATVPDLIAPEAAWSPAGDAFVVERADGLYIARAPDFEPALLAETAPPSRLVGSFKRAAWSPDGTRIAFTGPRPEGDGDVQLDTIYVADADGGNVRDVLPGDLARTSTGTAGKLPNVWLDDETIAFDAHRGTGLRVPMTVNVETGDVTKVLPGGDGAPAGGTSILWSPDRRYMALSSAVPAQRSGILRIANVETGERWDVPIDAGGAEVAGWLVDSSGLVYLAGDHHGGSLNIAHPVDERTEEVLSWPESFIIGSVGALVSDDGPSVVLEGVQLGTCEVPAQAPPGDCVAFVDVSTGTPAATWYLPAGDSVAGSGPHGLREWVSPGRAAFIGVHPEPPLRVLWLVSSDAAAEPVVWQEDVPGEGIMSVHASPDGRYAVVMMPTGSALGGGINLWQGRVYELP